jgi:hypothetical protein
VSEVVHEELVGADCIYIVSDEKAGRRNKTKQSARAIPIHRQLIDAGFLRFVAEQAKVLGDKIAPSGSAGTLAHMA